MRRILVVDDNTPSRELLRAVVKGPNREVVEAAHGREALERAAAAPPDLVLLDLQIPAPDGFAVLRRLRGDPRLAAVPVVAVTASAMQGDREKALAAGFDEYITKPIVAAEVRRRVRELLDE